MFGEIPGSPPGTRFVNRRAAFDAGVHRTTQAGIAGTFEGSESICLSDGYSDDDIQGDLITYTGFGGRDPKTGRHVADQKLVQGNAGLVRDHELRLPVRVLAKESVLTGNKKGTSYIYLGLFLVTQWSWGERDGFKVLQFQLQADPLDSYTPAEISKALVRGEDLPPLRRTSLTNRRVRNAAVAETVKSLYKNTCQICRTQLRTAAGTYAEAAHVRPLGIPHDGPDILENLLCLCPNCHKAFDGHAVTVDESGKVYEFERYKSDLLIHQQHHLDMGYLAYHRDISKGKSK
ncbi:HNH endonuclease [Arthrobacter jiangjiafuii]|uniref:HNH endonuclease n=1 Tax=Arthrobacter jiangjiafuii TaxID=2817475 RepID=A0A975M6H0_9MICC|nr:YDG/SRA domain-containing protein [Arthrobacter jiangjiafuii]MBP3043693.1 HNH endonuclease [Arthrobacter jiangjiafuii]QWC10725.1 HNH endonuclease [Arthrobacter jiangjiafuii]